MKEIGAVTIGKLIEAHYEKDEHKFKAYAFFIAEAYKESGEERAERIIRSKIDGSYKNKSVFIQSGEAMTDKFDEWFEETYSDYVIKETHKFLEPYYSIAEDAYAAGEKESADDFENMKAGLESEIARLKEKIESDKELIHKLRLVLIQERTANLCNGIDAVKMFDDMLKAAGKYL